MVKFKIIYLLLFVVAIFLLYHLLDGCGCANGVIESFSVGGQNKINISNLLSLSYIPECNPPGPPPSPPPSIYPCGADTKRSVDGINWDETKFSKQNNACSKAKNKTSCLNLNYCTWDENRANNICKCRYPYMNSRGETYCHNQPGKVKRLALSVKRCEKKTSHIDCKNDNFCELIKKNNN